MKKTHIATHFVASAMSGAYLQIICCRKRAVKIVLNIKNMTKYENNNISSLLGDEY